MDPESFCVEVRGWISCFELEPWFWSNLNSLFQPVLSNTRLEDLYLADLITRDGNDTNSKKGSQADVALISDPFDKSLVEGISNNARAPMADLRYNFDKEDCSVYIKLLALFVADKPFERELLPQQLCPLLRLLAACYDERYALLIVTMCVNFEILFICSFLILAFII